MISEEKDTSTLVETIEEEHERYAHNLTSIISYREAPVDLVKLVSRKEKKSPLIEEFWKNVTSTQKRKLETISEHTTLMEEHATTVVKLTSQQDQIIREKFTSCLKNKDTGECSPPKNSIWPAQDARTNYYIIDLGDKDTLNWIIEEEEEGSIDRTEGTEDKNNIDKYTINEGNSEEFEKIIAKMEEKMNLLNSLSEKFHYLSNTCPIPAESYDQLKMLDIFIVKSISSHLDTIIKLNGIMKNTPEYISTKIDVRDFIYKADGILEFFERPNQIPSFLLEVANGPSNPDPDKINGDRKKLMNEGFADKVEIGQMIFIGSGLYLFSPFTIPTLTIPTFNINLKHAPRLIRTLLRLRYNIIKKIERFKEFAKEGQRRIAKPKIKYATGVTSERLKA
ncbi:10215_t:CDS:2, partial [Diversispora eburnea]